MSSWLDNAATPLTKRESEVIELVSLGYSHRYVAQRLTLSVHTVSCHVERVYPKLGVATRDELVELREAAGA